MSNRETCSKLVPKDYPVEITKETQTSDCQIIEGKFLSPLELYLPGLVPEAAKDAHFQLILPNKWKDEDYKPVCLHLAGTGDHVSCANLNRRWFVTQLPIFLVFLETSQPDRQAADEGSGAGRDHPRKSFLRRAQAGGSKRIVAA